MYRGITVPTVSLQRLDVTSSVTTGSDIEVYIEVASRRLAVPLFGAAGKPYLFAGISYVIMRNGSCAITSTLQVITERD